jgi:hypothetical protein
VFFATMVDALVVCDFVIIVMEDFLKCECDVTSRQPTISRAKQKPKTNHSVHFMSPSKSSQVNTT